MLTAVEPRTLESTKSMNPYFRKLENNPLKTACRKLESYLDSDYRGQGFPQAVYTWGDLSPHMGGQSVNGGDS